MNQTGSQLHIPHQPASSRRPQKFEFLLGQDTGDFEAGILSATDRETQKRKFTVNAHDKDAFNSSVAQLSAQTPNAGMSKYQQSRIAGSTRAKSTNNRTSK